MDKLTGVEQAVYRPNPSRDRVPAKHVELDLGSAGAGSDGSGDGGGGSGDGSGGSGGSGGGGGGQSASTPTCRRILSGFGEQGIGQVGLVIIVGRHAELFLVRVRKRTVRRLSLLSPDRPASGR